MRKPDAIITDMDGTLLGPDGQIGARDKAAIRRMQQLGVPVIPGTGRPVFGLGKQAAEMGLRVALCSNGGCCYDFDREEILFARTIDHATVLRLVDWVCRRGLRCMLHAVHSIYVTPGVQIFSHYDLPEEQKGVAAPGMPLDGVDILKALVIDCDENQVIGELAGVFSPQELTICSSGANLVDINAPGVGKGSGVRQLAALRGWRMENILAIGDNFNDRTMLEAVGMSVVPANGKEEVKRAAGFVTAPCGSNPLSAAIDYYCPGLLDGI